MTGDRPEEYLKKFGSHALAYSALQDGVAHFKLPGVGFLPYSNSTTGSIAFGLSNPICDTSDYARITEGFLEEFPKATFVQVTEEYAEVLDSLGFFVNELGFETEIRLKDYTYSGRIKEDVRRGIKKAQLMGVEVKEITDPALIANELREVTDDWIKTKIVNDKELEFVARRAVYAREPGVRKFGAWRSGRLEGFVFFDPIYSLGDVSGYHLDILRARSDGHAATIRLIVKEAIECFKSEGVPVLSLGISPDLEGGGLFGAQESFRHNPLTRVALKTLYKYGNNLYPFQNLSFAKSRYGGGFSDGLYRDTNVIKKKVYFATRVRLPLREMYGASRVTGVVEGVIPALMKLLIKPALPARPERTGAAGVGSSGRLGVARGGL